MKIKRVEILGFKSFVDKVTLDFQQGITSIVGPNGCGKSNTVDAIRWAMGEQNAKNLRGRAMEDIIFGGSESRKPLGMAEVTMIFANDDGLAPPAFRDYAEIMVTRRLYRNGESEYLLNKTPCRLLDITELFMDTGVGARAYSIIEQGKIGMILSAKPEDRRFLIEEAAGVTKYKSRKKSALRKIDGTKQNLLRLGDIVSEVRRQLGSLKRQAQKAQRYREYREELRQIETRIALLRLDELQIEAEGVVSQEEEYGSVLELLQGQLAQGELQLEELRLLQTASEKDVSQGQEQVFHLTSEMQRIEGRIGFGEKEHEGLELQKERLAVENEETARRLADVDREEESLAASETALASSLEQEVSRLVEGESALGELTDGERELSVTLETTRGALFALLTELSRLGSRQADAGRRLESLAERTARNRQEAVALREQLDEGELRAGELEVALRSFRDRQDLLRQEQDEGGRLLAALRRQIEENENSLLVRREELSRASSRLESLQELERNLEGYGGGVRTVMREAPRRERFLGMIADLMEVPAEWEVAAEAVLGENLQALLVADSADAWETLAFLQQKGGRSTFLLPVAPPATFFAIAGSLPLTERVVPRAGAEAAVASLLQGVFVVPSLEPFLNQALPLGVTLVTAGGETLTYRGELHGGGQEELDGGLLHKKREMKELASLIGEAEGDVSALQNQRRELREQLQQGEEAQQEIAAALHRKEIKVGDCEKDLGRLRQEAQRVLERLEVLSLEEDQLHEERETLEGQKTAAESGRQEKEGEKLAQENAVTRLQEELRVQRQTLDKIREEVTSRKVAVASLREREEGGRRSLERLEALRQELRGRLVLIKSRQEEAELSQARLGQERERLRVELDVLYRRREEENARYLALRERFDAGGQQVEEQELALKGVRARLTEARDALATVQLKVRELRMETEHLVQSFLDRYRIDLLEVQDPREDKALDPDVAGRRLGELRRLVDEMGEVNLTAIEEYQELETRYEFLAGQQEDLRQSLEGLQSAITKINRTTRKRFRETFDLVNAKFQEVFPRLFRGGTAELRLTDEQDLLETGIEIVVQPPGKRLQNVNLLSGGEKALTAVALIFSIFLIKPTPFCMLDEVDAPLDDANIGRFNEMVREMSAVSQFIIITHNKRTMEIADSLYGVTMEEPGVSKLVSVRINEF
jgi:chromosome segregation protein